MNNKVFCVLILVAFLNSCSRFEKSSQKTAQEKTNIIFILADDLGYGDLSIYGQDKFSTPNIDALANRGALFTRHYAGSTVCAPSRSSLLTGQHTGHTYIRGNKEIRPEGQLPLLSSLHTLPKTFKSKGYVTGIFGKWGLGYPGSEGDPLNQGFDEFFGYNCQRLAHNYYPLHLWKNKTKIHLDKNAGKSNQIYAPELIHNEALGFIEKHKDTTFFMFYPSVIPHAELVAPEKYMNKFRGKLLPEKPFQGTDMGKRFKNGGYMSQKEPHTAFAAMISLLDQQVGDITKKLKSLGILENTIIVFTSDNGPHMEGGANPDFFNSNGNHRGYKRDLYEGGIKVPMLISWPSKIKEPIETDHIAAFWDFYPTFCEIINEKTPKGIDGISFLSTLLGEEQKSHKHLYWEFHEKGGKQAVRMGKWKGVRLFVNDTVKTRFELYNLKLDQEENFDVAKQHPKVVQEIKSIMKNEHSSSEIFKFDYE